jgi:NADPH:quinone reductase-like Zn-dependent oxidoreductase
VLKIVENDLRGPAPGEARVKILAVGVCQDDIANRVGNRPFLPKVPFVPGYDIVGVVDAIGAGVTEVAVGDRVAALTVAAAMPNISTSARISWCACQPL